MLAADCEARALHETEPFFRGQWEHMGANYRRLAVMADLNARNDVVFETPPTQLNVHQQQQIQPEPTLETGIESPEGHPRKIP